jgi:hypothetical protein
VSADPGRRAWALDIVTHPHDTDSGDSRLAVAYRVLAADAAAHEDFDACQNLAAIADHTRTPAPDRSSR